MDVFVVINEHQCIVPGGNNGIEKKSSYSRCKSTKVYEFKKRF